MNAVQPVLSVKWVGRNQQLWLVVSINIRARRFARLTQVLNRNIFTMAGKYLTGVISLILFCHLRIIFSTIIIQVKCALFGSTKKYTTFLKRKILKLSKN